MTGVLVATVLIAVVSLAALLLAGVGALPAVLVLVAFVGIGFAVSHTRRARGPDVPS